MQQPLTAILLAALISLGRTSLPTSPTSVPTNTSAVFPSTELPKQSNNEATKPPVGTSKFQLLSHILYLENTVALFNWYSNDDLTEDILKKVYAELSPIKAEDGCAHGWIQFGESCYFIETELLSQTEAAERCFLKNSTLLVANTLQEWKAVVPSLPTGYTWIGLQRKSKNYRDDILPTWQIIDGINPAFMNWLVIPYDLWMASIQWLRNGWSPKQQCVAYVNVPKNSKNFIYYHRCSKRFASVCERNSTFVNIISSRQSQMIPY